MHAYMNFRAIDHSLKSTVVAIGGPTFHTTNSLNSSTLFIVTNIFYNYVRLCSIDCRIIIIDLKNPNFRAAAQQCQNESEFYRYR